MIHNQRTIDFMGVHVDVLDTQGLYNRIIDLIRGSNSYKVMYVNAHCMLISQKDTEYRTILNDADTVYADGISIAWAARIFGHRFPGRSTAADFMPRFCRLFAENGFRIYMLGAKPGVAEAASERLQLENSKLQIAGTHHGYFSRKDDQKIIEGINRARPHILLVGMGVPYQEKWIQEHHSTLDVPVIWGVGALFDFLSGKTARGPQWLLDNGFEWLCRLCVEPRRLWKRYLFGNLLFMWCVFNWKYFKKR